MEVSSVLQQRIRRVSNHEAKDLYDHLAVEEPLEIRVSYKDGDLRTEKSISVTMRTPGQDEELAVGFLFTEGIVHKPRDVQKVSIPLFQENSVLVTLSDAFSPKLNTLERNFYTTSSCGVCGKASIDAIKIVSNSTFEKKSIKITREIVFRLSRQIAVEQRIFESTGGLHASSLFNQNGDLIMLREDVGRHNALDKLIGAAFLSEALPLSENILLLSGRASFELIQKASMAGIQIVAAIGAPSSLAVQMAEESDMTLIGFLKSDKFNIYTGFDRIINL
jgi:FdhD protein